MEFDEDDELRTVSDGERATVEGNEDDGSDDWDADFRIAERRAPPSASDRFTDRDDGDDEEGGDEGDPGCCDEGLKLTIDAEWPGLTPVTAIPCGDGDEAAVARVTMGRIGSNRTNLSTVLGNSSNPPRKMVSMPKSIIM